MELNKYRTASTRNRKIKKITVAGAAIFCAISLFIGIFIGKSFSSGKVEDAQKKVNAMESILAEANTKLKTYEVYFENNKNPISDSAVQNEQSPDASSDVIADTSTSFGNQKSSGSGILGKLLIGLLVVIIIIGILFGASIYLKKNNSSSDEDDDDEEYEDEEYEDEEEYEEYEDEEYEDEEYEDDDEEYEDEEDADKE